MFIIQEYSGFLIDGTGSINPDGLRLAMELENISEYKQSDLCKKISLYLRIALKSQRG